MRISIRCHGKQFLLILITMQSLTLNKNTQTTELFYLVLSLREHLKLGTFPLGTQCANNKDHFSVPNGNNGAVSNSNT